MQLLAAGEDVDIILDQTPFYAESGGQIGDHGQLHTVPESSSNGASAAPPAHASVSDVRKMSGDFFLHRASIQSGRLHVGQQVCVALGWQSKCSLGQDRCTHAAVLVHHLCTRPLSTCTWGSR